jgi:hypothetical protein
MYDMSGEGWVRHFLYGTSKILQLFGPERCLSNLGRQFFLTIRVFEISRALIFTEETFLSDESWQSLMAQMWGSDTANDWHPKEALFNLMTSCSALGIRSMTLIRSFSDLSQKEQQRQLQAIAADGLDLQLSLHGWGTAATSWWAPSAPAEDVQMTLSLIFYNAITIYLSGLFDYFPYWHERHILSPIILRSEVEERLQMIMTGVDHALKHTNLAGVLFMFPLRVAGARAKTVEQRSLIEGMLNNISKRGFVVADSFVVDLKQVWDHKTAPEVVLAG